MRSCNQSVLLSFLFFLLACCFPAEAAYLTQKRSHEEVSLRGSKTTKKHREVKATKSSNQDNEDDEDDDDDEEEEDETQKLSPEDAEVARLKEKLQDVEEDVEANRRQRSQFQRELKHLSDESASDTEIEAHAKLVANETSAPALASTLGQMWKELRMFQLPFYAEHAQEEMHRLKREEGSLEAQQKTIQNQLVLAQQEAARAKKEKDAEEEKEKEEEDAKKEEKAEKKQEEEKEEEKVEKKEDEEDEDSKDETKEEAQDDGESEGGGGQSAVQQEVPITSVGDAGANARRVQWNFWSMTRTQKKSVLLSSFVYLLCGILLAYIYRKFASLYPEAFSPKKRPEMYANKTDFTFSIFGCVADPMMCMLGCCCPAMRWADTLFQKRLISYWRGFFMFFMLFLLHIYTLGLSSLVMIGLGVYYRHKLREKYNMDNTGSTLMHDCLAWCFCMPCAIIQEARESGVMRM